MPKVPQYQRQVISTGMPDVRVHAPDSSAFGGSVGAAMGNVGQAIVRAGDEVNNQLIEQQQKVNTQKTLDLSAKFDSMLASDFHNGYFTLKGKDAFGMAKDANKHLDNKFKELVESADNDVQKLALTQYAMPRVQQYRKLMMEHEQQQVDFATDQAYTDQMTSSERMAVADRNNPELFMTHLNAGLQAQELKLRRKGLTPESIASQSQTYTSQITKNAVLADINEGNIDGAQKKMQMYSDKLDALDKAELEGKIRPLVQNNEIVKYVDELKKDPSNFTNGVFDATKARAKIEERYGPNAKKTVTVPGSGGPSWESIKASGEKELGKAYELGGAGATGNTTDCGQFTLDTYRRLGIDLGTRGADGQYRNLEVKGTTFTDRNQLKPGDMVFFSGTSSRWEPSDDPAAVNDSTKAYKGITHVGIYAGDGKVLQAGSAGVGYKDMDSIGTVAGFGKVSADAGATTQTVSAFDARVYERAINLVDAAAVDSRREKSIRDADELDRVRNAIVGVSDTEKINIIQNSGLEPYQKDAMVKQLTTRTSSDIGALAALEKLAAKGALTEKDVLNQASLLTQDKLMHYLGRAYNIDANRADKESADADKQWHAYIEEKGPYSNDKKKNEELLVNITGRLNAEGLKGYARYDRALALMKEEDKSKGSIIYYTLNNNTEYQQLVKDFDPKLVDLTVAGLKATGQWTGSYRTVNVFLSQIGQDIQNGDTAAQEALDLLIRTNTAINPTTYANARAAVSR